MCAERNIPYIDHANSIQPENHLNESKLHFNRYGTIAFADSISKFLLEHYWWCHDSSNFDHLFQENFDKESKTFSQPLHKENHKRASIPSKTIVLNYTNFEREESFLLDQSTSSTFAHKLNLDPYSNIANVRSKKPSILIIAQLNINSVRYKFDLVIEIFHSNVEILLISETKIDSSLCTAQFKIEGYATYRLDRNSNGGGILLCVREYIPSTLLNTELLIESFCIEINIRKKKWLLVCTYNQNKNLISNHLKEIGIKIGQLFL